MKYPASQFAEDTGVPQDVAERLMSALYDNNLDVCDLNAVLWRLKDFVTKRGIGDLLSKATNADIKEIVSQFVAEKKMYMYQVPSDVCCAETVDDLITAFSSGVSPESAWFFSSIDSKGKTFKVGDIVTIQILRAGEWNHDSYGKVKIDKKVINDVVTNFKENKRGIDLAVDENHEENHKALGWFREVYSEDDGSKCFAKIELTQKGAELLNEGAYKYFSPEISFRKVDEETGKPQRNLLLGGAFTNRPFFKGMQPLMASENAANGEKVNTDHIDGHAYFFSNNATMFKLMLLMDKLLQKDTITASEKSELELRFNELPESDKVTTKATVDELLAKFSEDEKITEADTAKNSTEDDSEDDSEEVVEDKSEEVAQVDGIKANEDGTFAITDQVAFSEAMKAIKKQQMQLSEQTRVLRFNEVTESVKKLQFSEKTKKGIFLLPKDAKKFAEFAMSLSEAKAKEFFDIMSSLPTQETAKKFKEEGHGKEIAKADVTKPETFSENDEVVKHFMEVMSQPLAIAQKSAADYYRTHSSQL